MSSYLTIYVQHKGDDKKHPILIYSRNNDIYQAFNENLNIAYAGMEDKYSELTENDISIVLGDLQKDIDSAERRIQEYEKHAAGNSECIDEIIRMREYRDDLQRTYYKVESIMDIMSDIPYGSDIEHVYCNID